MKTVFIGAGGHSLSVIDCFNKDEIAGFIDAHKDGLHAGFPILARSIYEFKDRHKYKYHISIGDRDYREKIRNELEELGLELVNVIAKEAIVSERTIIGKGNFIGKNVVINAGVEIGDNNIINTGAVIEHGCSIGNNSAVAALAVLNGDVKIGDGVIIGSNAVCNGQISIGDYATVGSGAVVTKNVEARTTVVGIPAREIAL